MTLLGAISLTLIIAPIALLTLVALIGALCERAREFVDEVGRQTETHP